MLFLDNLLNFLGNTLFERLLSVALLATVAYLSYRWIFEPIYIASKGMWNFWTMRNRPSAILEITPPEHIEKSPLATQQLFAVSNSLFTEMKSCRSRLMQRVRRVFAISSVYALMMLPCFSGKSQHIYQKLNLKCSSQYWTMRSARMVASLR